MAEERADALIEFGSDDVFETAGLQVRFGVFDGKSIGEEAFGKTMAADYIAGAARTGFGEMNFSAAVGNGAA
jgi:hypothetical protein